MVLTVPPAASLGETVQLNCSYHLQGESLYAIKLYKGRDEFLTYAAERVPPLRTFPLKGIHLGVSIYLRIFQPAKRFWRVLVTEFPRMIMSLFPFCIFFTAYLFYRLLVLTAYLFYQLLVLCLFFFILF